METKIFFRDEIHGMSNLPDNLSGLVERIESIFKDQLQRPWKLYTIDTQGTQTNIYNDQDYRDLQEKQSKYPQETIKLYIEPLVTEEQRRSTNDKIINMSLESEEIAMEKGDKDITGALERNQYSGHRKTIPEDVMEVLSVLSEKYSSQNNREKMAEAIQRDYSSPKHNEVSRPGARPQPHDEGFQNKRKMHKAKHLIKKLAKGRFCGAKKEHMLEKLKIIKASLPPALQEELKVKEEKGCMKSKDKNRKEKHHGKHHHRKHKHWQECDYEDGREKYDKLDKIVLLARENINREALENNTTNQDNLGTGLQAQFNDEGKTVHHNIVCCGCGMVPIIGVRYKCSQCPKFDYCEKCEDASSHPHLFLKMRESTATVAQSETIRVNQNSNSLKESFRKFKAFKITKKMIKAMKKGDAHKFNKLHEKLFSDFYKEACEVLNSASEWYPEGKEGLINELKKFKADNRTTKMGKLEKPKSQRQSNFSSQEAERLYKSVNKSLAELTLEDSNQEK